MVPASPACLMIGPQTQIILSSTRRRFKARREAPRALWCPKQVHGPLMFVVGARPTPSTFPPARAPAVQNAAIARPKNGKLDVAPAKVSSWMFEPIDQYGRVYDTSLPVPPPT